jgi:hypothetical protein
MAQSQNKVAFEKHISLGNKVKKQAFGDKGLKFSGHVNKTQRKFSGGGDISGVTSVDL